MGCSNPTLRIADPIREKNELNLQEPFQSDNHGKYPVFQQPNPLTFQHLLEPSAMSFYLRLPQLVA
jgi:hypothetical protein